MANKSLYSSKSTQQITKLAGELVERPFYESKSLGFMSRLFVMVNLPYRNTGKDTRVWLRKNGAVTLVVTPAYNSKGKNIGIPYGTYPRLILAYLISQAVKTQSPEISLGKSFRDFLKLLGIEKGGKQYKQLENQLERTLSATFSWSYENEKQWSRTNIQVSHHAQLWWNPKYPEQTTLWESYIKLNTDFFNEIIRKSIPLDFRILKVLKNSPFSLDLYMFLSWRVFTLKKPICLSWKNLHNQFGGQYASLTVFSRDCRKHLERIQAIWPELNVLPVRGRLHIHPVSRMLINPVKKRVVD